MHGIIASGSIRVIFPLSLYSATRFDDHATSLPARVRKVKSKAYRTELVAAIFFSAAHSKSSHNSAPLRSHVHCLAVRTAASAMLRRGKAAPAIAQAPASHSDREERSHRLYRL